MDDFVTFGAEEEPATPAASSRDPWTHAKKTHTKKSRKDAIVALLASEI
jgi:hypothetical protein